MTDNKTISVYDSQVDDYIAMLDQLPVDNILLAFIKRFKLNDYVLDLGCGPAVSSATMRDHGLRVDPIDASTEMVRLANERFSINARLASFDDVIIESTGKTQNTYDGIWANFSLLHATREEFPTILKQLQQALKPKGLLHIGMKIGQGCYRDKLGRLYSYYSQDELQGFLNDAGYSIEKMILDEDKGLAGNIEPWIAITSSSK